MNRIILVVITLISIPCHAQNCRTLPNRFTSYSKAVSSIEGSKFEISESVITTESSWIRSAHYYAVMVKPAFL